ncbi:MAG TPA: hypothetical protein EYG28_04755 [Nitrospiria bacterium]|nr:hypothetical protein [Candidatus Manganitrophaceae bacterium]HIL34696.1 hypothetical protein [Candidatus Manganitrophaceae bacterium]
MLDIIHYSTAFRALRATRHSEDLNKGPVGDPLPKLIMIVLERGGKCGEGWCPQATVLDSGIRRNDEVNQRVSLLNISGSGAERPPPFLS